MSQNFIMKIPWRPPYQYKKLGLIFLQNWLDLIPKTNISLLFDIFKKLNKFTKWQLFSFKTTNVFTQTILSENRCHFMNFLSFAKGHITVIIDFFRKINLEKNPSQVKTVKFIEKSGFQCYFSCLWFYFYQETVTQWNWIKLTKLKILLTRNY